MGAYIRACDAISSTCSWLACFRWPVTIKWSATLGSQPEVAAQVRPLRGLNANDWAEMATRARAYGCETETTYSWCSIFSHVSNIDTPIYARARHKGPLFNWQNHWDLQLIANEKPLVQRASCARPRSGPTTLACARPAHHARIMRGLLLSSWGRLWRPPAPRRTPSASNAGVGYASSCTTAATLVPRVASAVE